MEGATLAFVTLNFMLYYAGSNGRTEVKAICSLVGNFPKLVGHCRVISHHPRSIQRTPVYIGGGCGNIFGDLVTVLGPLRRDIYWFLKTYL